MLEPLRPYLRATSWPIILAMLALMGVSLMALHAAEAADPANRIVQGTTARQGVWICIALAGFVAATLVPFQRLGRWSYALFGVNLLLLVIVLMLPPISGSRRWIKLGPMRFQPSELAKLTTIMALSWYLRYRENFRRLPGLIPPFLVALVPAVLILKEPDLGTTLLLFPTLLFMLFVAGARPRHLLTVVGVVAVIALLPVPCPLAGVSAGEAAARKSLAYWQGRIGGTDYVVVAAPLWKMKPYQIRRVEGWLRQGDDEVASDTNFQLAKSKMVLGSGGLAGNDASEALDLYIWWLPEDHTDFIFAVIGGRWGFVGCAGVVLLYAIIFVCGAEIASITQDPFGRLLVMGVLALLFVQILINVGMTLGLMPITGMTLPLVSFGGSSMLVNAAALGLMINVSRRRPRNLGPRPFEHDAVAPERRASCPTPVESLAGRGRGKP